MISNEDSNVSMPKPEKYVSNYKWSSYLNDLYGWSDMPSTNNSSPVEVEWDMLYVYEHITLYGDNWPIKLAPGDYWIGNHGDDEIAYEDPLSD